MADDVVELICECKHDEWGKKGNNSLAGRLWSRMPGAGELKDSETYSEMWMGTYPTVPSRVTSNGELLSEYLKNNPDLVGQSVCDRYGPDLPFLPKILSFDKALPLQIHPDKSLAEQLHAKDPKKFGDTNHKPEIAVALSRFELFVGFKPVEELANIMRLKAVEQFVPTKSDFNDEALREICKTFLSFPPTTVSEMITKLKDTPESEFGKYRYIPSLLNRLSEQYSEFDNGNLVAALLMNYMTLEPGEAVCVPADSIHAYLSGDILECMARSDNVLNTGFCPRADRDDVDLFAQALTFKPHNSEAAHLPPQVSQFGEKGKTLVYAPPFSEFNVLGISLSPAETETHAVLQSPSILAVTQGSGEMKVSGVGKTIHVEEGNVFFAGCNAKLQFSTETGLTFYRAYATF
ncbi:hypothetical protein N7510_004586 [Penicillium lagena]|uniref:uncharacterized protein n=1 Tax=Penicillium lagena TaxID=94218 RepID=UPI002540D64F|nr:uncharacterized protein N7510_004586 [Penicillium lagena]KAJ5620602.1 hypothetical protein N7510_004586 [Penicillium lagena]